MNIFEQNVTVKMKFCARKNEYNKASDIMVNVNNKLFKVMENVGNAIM